VGRRRQCLFLRRSAAPSSRRHRDRKKGRLALSKRSSLFSSRKGRSSFFGRYYSWLFTRPSARVAEEFDSVVTLFFALLFLDAFGTLFSLSGEFLTSFSALFSSRFFPLPSLSGVSAVTNFLRSQIIENFHWPALFLCVCEQQQKSRRRRLDASSNTFFSFSLETKAQKEQKNNVQTT